MRNHKDLEVWKKAIELATDCYRVTNGFPIDEKYGLTSQMRRAAVSIASNIAEGAARTSQKEFLQFLSFAAGSASELNTQILISRRIGIGDAADLDDLEEKTNLASRMLQGLIRSIRNKTCD
ncbi:four helix bundle protein [Syntrophotalea acetylenica]|uniref:Four helix bundle protein n=1 Tax=Syntrophotalea acetylenica TaxID=29542 RepID=A0A1L3GID7_SYNAC|nr:four helix bundle protein [Syntrophotalea acetylenica]APG25679.1 four helix bundle protein [Syntrophotalea acetylenica]APG43751.1 four helix bundle protein [Syntrophotalea acetylenica]